MALETMIVPHLGGGIRNDSVTQAISAAESWDALNEDSSLLLGASSKRKGCIKVGALADSIRCIYEGKAWEKKRIIVTGGKIYEFDPPSTFTEIYDGFDGGKHDFVRIAPFIDDYVGGVFVIMDGVNRPMYWDGTGSPVELPSNAPIAKYGLMHKTYFVMANLMLPSTLIYDGGDIEMGAVAANNYSNVQELSVNWVSGEIVGVIAESSTAGDFDIHIFSEEPLGWNTNTTSNQHPMYKTSHVFSQATINTKGWRDLGLQDDFYTTNRKLYIAVFNDDASAATIKIRILYKTKFYNLSQDIKWCDAKNINEWTISDSTLCGRLSLYTSEGGDIINALPLNRDIFMVYKEDGAIIACYTTGSSVNVFDYKTLTEGHKLVSGDAILAWGGYHWALSTEGFLQIDASSVKFVEPYGKAKKIFDILNDNWKNSHGSVLEHEHKIAISYPRSGDEEKDGVLIYDIRNGTYDKWDLGLNVIGVCSIDDAGTMDSFSGLTVDDMSGHTVDDLRLKMQRPEFYGGDYSGNVYRIGWTNSDDGVAIDGWSESGWIWPKQIKEKYSDSDKFWFRYIELELDMMGDFSLTLEYKVDYTDTWTTLPTISLSQGSRGLITKVVKRYINGVGRAIKIRRKNSTAGESYTVRSMNIGYEKVGGR